MKQLRTFEDVHHTASGIIPVDPIGKIQRRFAEKQIAALVLKGKQGSLNGADGLGRNVSVGQFIFFGVVTDKLHHRAQILQVDQQQLLIVGNAENDPQYAFLRFVEP